MKFTVILLLVALAATSALMAQTAPTAKVLRAKTVFAHKSLGLHPDKMPKLTHKYLVWEKASARHAATTRRDAAKGAFEQKTLQERSACCPACKHEGKSCCPKGMTEHKCHGQKGQMPAPKEPASPDCCK